MSYRISNLIYPRITVLITTCNKLGRPNVASFSFVMPVSFEPKYIAFSVAPTRYTYENLKEVGEFVVNVPTAEMLREVWICGTRSGRGVDKFSLAGLTPLDSVVVKPPRIAECPVQLECVVEYMERFGDHYLVVGRVVKEHVKCSEFEPLLHHSRRVFYTKGKKLEAAE